MKVTTTKGVEIIMRPPVLADAAVFSEGFSSYPVVKTLTMRSSNSVAAEEKWIRDHDQSETSCGWTLELNGEAVGNTGLDNIQDRRATSGCCIYRADLWGQGIMSAVHRARMYYVDHVMGLEAVESAVLDGNTASSRALEKVGYVTYGVKLGMAFAEGKNRHGTSLLWVNPNQSRWNSFWDGPLPEAYAEQFQAGRKRARAALKQAERSVVFL